MKIPIPYVAYWSDELDRDYVVRPDPLLDDQLALFSQGTRGVGRPVLGIMNEQRQREVVIQGRCQVCANLIKRKRWLVTFGQNEIVGGEVVPLIREPWACTGCMVAAVRVCPGLKATRHLPILELHRWQVVVTMTSLPSRTEPDKVDPAAPVVIGMLKIIPRAADRWTVDDFLTKHGDAECRAPLHDIADPTAAIREEENRRRGPK